MANKYLRAGASGSGSGDDWTNAYTTLAALESGLARGDTGYVADGTYGGATFNTALSGTTLITIKKATVADHGTSTGWDNAYGDGQAVLGKLQFDTGYWTLDGQSRSGIRSGYGFKVDGNTSPSTANCIGIGSTAPASAHNVTLRYVEVHGSGEDPGSDTYNDPNVYATRSNNLTIEYCWLHDNGIKNVMFLGVDGDNRASNLLVQHCVIEKNNSTAANHGEGFQLAFTNGVVIRHNILSDMEGTTYIGTPYASSHSNGNLEIYGNVFLRESTPSREDPGHGPISLWDCSWGDVSIYNNTFINFNGTTVNLVGDGVIAHTTTVANLYFRNNLFVDCININETSCIATGGSVTGTFTWSHNAYWNCTSVTDADANRQNLGSDPLPNWETGTYTLTAATTAGATLASPYDTDPAGVTRGADGTWDRGAYEYSATSDTGAGKRVCGFMLTPVA